MSRSSTSGCRPTIRIQKPRYSAERPPGNHTTFPARIAAADRSHFIFKGEESRGNGVAFPVLSQHGFLTCVQPAAPGHVGVACAVGSLAMAARHGMAWSSVAAVVDASTGRRIVLSWFVLLGRRSTYPGNSR